MKIHKQSMETNENRWKSVEINKKSIKINANPRKFMKMHANHMKIHKNPAIESSSQRVLELGGRGGSL